MKKSRFSGEEIVKALNKVEEGTSMRELSVETGVCETTLYRWKREYSGLSPDGIEDSREVARENARLRRTLYLQRIELEVLRSQLENSQDEKPHGSFRPHKIAATSFSESAES